MGPSAHAPPPGSGARLTASPASPADRSYRLWGASASASASASGGEAGPHKRQHPLLWDPSSLAVLSAFRQVLRNTQGIVVDSGEAPCGVLSSAGGACPACMSLWTAAASAADMWWAARAGCGGPSARAAPNARWPCLLSSCAQLTLGSCPPVQYPPFSAPSHAPRAFLVCCTPFRHAPAPAAAPSQATVNVWSLGLLSGGPCCGAPC